MIIEIGSFKIEIYKDSTFTIDSTNNVNNYEHVYFTPSDDTLTTVIGIKVYENDNLIKTAIIGSEGGGTGIHKTSQIIENDRLILCCSDSIFCLSIPDLDLIWNTKADECTCFEIYKYKNSYIVHGELEISRLDFNGKILWQRSGADIFTTMKGTDDFEITDSYIRATDWGNRTYKFDFDGKIIN